jgi:hypothetical protein
MVIVLIWIIFGKFDENNQKNGQNRALKFMLIRTILKIKKDKKLRIEKNFGRKGETPWKQKTIATI